MSGSKRVARVSSAYENEIDSKQVEVCNSSRGGKGVFAAEDMAKGSVITEYKGDEGFEDMRRLTHAQARLHTHTLRVKEGGGRLINGLVVSETAEKRGECWVVSARFQKGVGALLNAADSRPEVNARLTWLPDERNRRAGSTKISRTLLNILPKAAFFVATRHIRRGEELLWFYKPKVFEDEVSRSPSRSPSRSRSSRRNRSPRRSPRRSASRSPQRRFPNTIQEMIDTDTEVETEIDT
jgi:hypothetical protein